MPGGGNNGEFLVFNGVNGDRGEYELPPMSPEELLGFIQGKEPPENLAELRFRCRQRTARRGGKRPLQQSQRPPIIRRPLQGSRRTNRSPSSTAWP